MKVVFSLVFLASLSAHAATHCFYTSEVNIPAEVVSNYPQYANDPVMTKSSCEKPMCVSNIYCKDNEGAAYVSKAFCFAVSAKANSWHCPSADDCADDVTVSVKAMFPVQHDLPKTEAPRVVR